MKHKLKGIRFGVWLYFFMFSMAILLAFGALQVALIKPYYRDDRIRTIEIIANTIESEIIDNSNLTQNNVDKAFKAVLNNNVCTVIFNDKGQMVYESDALGATCIFNQEVVYNDDTFVIREEPRVLIDAINQKDGFSTTFISDYTNREMLVYAKKVDSNLANYYLLINSPLEPVESIINFFMNQYFLIGIVVLVIAIILSILLSRRIANPIVNMKKEANRLANGDYAATFVGESFEEINDLASTLNDATDKLGKMDELRKDLIANVSHDIKTPLTMIKAYAEMIIDISGDNKTKREEHLNVILKEADYLNRLVTDMRELSRMQAGYVVLTRSNFDLKEVVENVLFLYDKLIKEKALSINLDGVEAVIWADEVKITQVVSNYISNAIKHSKAASSIDIRIINHEDYVRFEVEDHGSGIEEKDLPYIWDRYYKIDKSFSRDINSTGLGLAIVRVILEAHKAKYGVESKVDVGSTFYFELSKDYEEED